MATDMEIVAGGGTSTPRIVQKLVRLRKFLWVISSLLLYFYVPFIFTAQNVETTRMSEHSLMPGLVTTKFDKAGLVGKYGHEIKALNKTRRLQSYVCDTLADHGIHCYTQKWKTKVASQKRRGENAYAFVRGPRSDGTEAMLFAVRLGHSESETAAIAVILAFAAYAKEQVYWARDIVLVFVDGNTNIDAALGMDAFLVAYYKQRNPALEVEFLQEAGGMLFAGIVYEVSQKKSSDCRISFKMNGVNGNQPNLDIFNGVVRILKSSQPECSLVLYGVDSNSRQPSHLIPRRAVYTQAFITVEGVHSVMSRYALQGFTITTHTPIDATKAGKLLEAIARMFNNALERLHQSYFMYILVDIHHFVSIAYYIPVIAIIIAPFIINAYYEWTKIEVFEIPTSFYLVHVYGIMTFAFGKIGTWINSGALVTREEAPLFADFDVTIETLVFLLMFVPGGIININIKSDNGTLRMILQLEIALVLGCLSLLNFGLAAIVGAFLLPLVSYCLSGLAVKSEIVIRGVLLALTHPIGLIFMGRNYLNQSIVMYGPVKQFMTVKLIQKLMETLIRDNVLFGSIAFPLFTIFAMPIWNLMFRALPFYTDVEIEERRKLARREDREKKNN